MTCSCCGSTLFERRGSRRVYAPLQADGDIDGWSEGDIDWDTDDGGNDLLYCVSCGADCPRPRVDTEPVAALDSEAHE